MKFPLLLALFFCGFGLHKAISQTVHIEKRPKWVKHYQPKFEWKNTDDITGAYYYLLVDEQVNIKLQSTFIHHAIKILNNEGIQKQSDIDVVYDPSYEKLIFHEVSVYRQGKKINKLKDHSFRTFYRERRGDRYLYDNSLEAVINLRDIRVDDIIIYSYSRVGFNPANKGNISSYFNFQYSLPVFQIKNRLISPIGEKISFHYSQFNLDPSIKKLNYGNEYIWEIDSVSALLRDQNTPKWYDPYPKLYYTDYTSWRHLLQNITPLYNFDRKLAESLKTKTQNLFTTSDKYKTIKQAIRFVQDDVRYLGFEEGIHAFKPHSPIQVLEQRFGDCKDKSFLLCSILKANNIEANPVLVNTSLKKEIKNRLPGLGVFNHCIAKIYLNDSAYFIDPTINYQGGKISNINFPDYGYGLEVKQNINQLTKIPISEERGTKVYQKMVVPNEKDSIIFKTKTIFYDSKADYNRSYFANNSLDEIETNYLDFYSGQYSGIKLNKRIKVTDIRDSDNQFIVEEEYLIKNFGVRSEEKYNIYNYSFYPIDFENYIYVPKSRERSMPYQTPYKNDYFLQIKLCFPGKVNGYIGAVSFAKKEFIYDYEADIIGDTILITHKYNVLKDHINKDKINDYLHDHKKMEDYLSYDVSFNLDKSIAYSHSWLLSFLGLFIFVIGFTVSYKAGYYYDLEPKYSLRRDKPIAGMLILVVLVLILNPALWLLSLLENGKYFNANIWKLIGDLPQTESETLQFLLGTNMVYEILQFSFLLILLLILFNKRTTFPKLAILYLITNAVYTTLFTFFMDIFEKGRFDLAPSSNMFLWTLFYTGFIIAYLKKSVRVEQTFIHMIK